MTMKSAFLFVDIFKYTLYFNFNLQKDKFDTFTVDFNEHNPHHNKLHLYEPHCSMLQ